MFITSTTRRFRRGVSMAEYGIMAALIVILGLTAVTTLGKSSETLFCTISHSVNNRTMELSDGSCNNKGGYGTGAVYNIASTVGAGCSGTDRPAVCTLADGQVLYALNKIDPVSGIYGLKSNGDVVTNYSEAMEALQAGNLRQYGVNNPVLGQSFQYEIQSASGNTYGVYYTGSTFGVRNLTNDTTYAYNWTTGGLDYTSASNNGGAW